MSQIMPLTPGLQWSLTTCVLQIRIIKFGFANMPGKSRKELKRKRKPGAGRKPAGPFKNNTAQLTIRMPDDLRDKLESSAKKKGRSLSQELLWRLQLSYRKQHEEEFRSRATRAICFLIGDIADGITFPESGRYRERLALWHRNPFQFRAFRLAVTQLLEALEPVGAMENPYESMVESWPKHDVFQAKYKEMAADLQTPETLADWLVHASLSQMLHPRANLQALTREIINTLPDSEIKRHAEYALDGLYGFANAKRDLEISDLEPER